MTAHLQRLADELVAGVAASGFVVVRDRPLSIGEQVDLTRVIGDVLADRSSVRPRAEVRWEVDLTEAGSSAPERRAAATRTYFNEQWHADMSWAGCDPPVTILVAEIADPDGASTEFADMCSAAAGLDAARRDQVRPWAAVHHVGLSRRVRHGRSDDAVPHAASWWRRHARQARQQRVGLSRLDGRYPWLRHVPTLPSPGVAKPIVDVDPRRGEEFVRVGDHAWTIVGMDASEGLRQLLRLEREALAVARCWRHEWQPGDVVAFDNGSLLHRRRPPIDPGARRVVRRTMVWPHAAVLGAR